MAESNQQGNVFQRAVHTVGDLSRFWKKPEEFAPPQQQQQQSGEQQYQQAPNNSQQQQQNIQQQHDGRGVDNDGNPLAVYKDLFNNTPPVGPDGKPVEQKGPPQFKIAPETLSKAAGQINFLDGIPQDIQERLQSGEPLDSKTVLALVQHAGQRAYSVSMEHASTLTDQFVGMRLSHDKQGLRGEVNKLLATNRVLSQPEIQKNPILKDHYQDIADRLADKYPAQTPEWIAEQTVAYFQEIGKIVGGGARDNQQQQQGIHTNPNGATVNEKGEEFDWDAYATK